MAENILAQSNEADVVLAWPNLEKIRKNRDLKYILGKFPLENPGTSRNYGRCGTGQKFYVMYVLEPALQREL